MFDQMKKGAIEVEWVSGTKETIEFQYNPTEWSFDKGVQLAEINIPGLDSPLIQFVRGQAETVTLNLFFDTTEDGMGTGATSVTTLTDRVYQLVKIEPDRHAPPLCNLVWNDAFPGADVSASVGNQKRNNFHCVVTQVKQTFNLFSPEGVPLRATLAVTFKEFKTLEDQLEQLGLNSPDRTHAHILDRGQRLSAVAYQYYKNPAKWREVADANEIDDPRRTIAGTLLSVPKIT